MLWIWKSWSRRRPKGRGLGGRVGTRTLAWGGRCGRGCGGGWDGDGDVKVNVDKVRVGGGPALRRKQVLKSVHDKC